MSVTVVTKAESKHLTTTATIKGVLGISSAKFDAELERLIGVATETIEDYVRHVYAKQTYEEILVGSAHTLLMLTNTPIISVTGIVCQSSPITDFEIRNADAGILYRAAGWASGEWVGWATESTRPVRGTSDMLYSVTYEAGYVTPGLPEPDLPAFIEQACVETVVDWYKSAKRDSAVKSKKVGDLSITYKGADEMISGDNRIPAGARALLSRRM